MPDQISALLDQIDRLDQQATKGPWTWGDNRDGLGNKLHPTAFPGKYNPIADLEYTDDEDAEFIALSRTALPALSSALRAVLELHTCLDMGEKHTPRYICEKCVDIQWNGAWDQQNYPCPTVQAITDALGDDDAA